MITTKVMPLESMRMERVSHLLRLPYYYRCFPNIASISSHLLTVFFFTEKQGDPKNESLTATCHSKSNKNSDSNVSKGNSRVKVIVTSDAPECHSILSIKLINEKTNKDEGTYQCRTAGKAKLASLQAEEGKFLKS